MAKGSWKDWLLLNPGKWLFSVVLFFNIGLFWVEKPNLIPNLVFYFVLPFVCIWFADWLGQYIRFTPSLKKVIRMPLPVFIQLVGWVLLVIPFVWVVLLNR